MARPTKQGVDYFPLDVHLDSKFKFVEIKYGLKGFAIIIKLLQKIYSNGYWSPFNEDEKLLFCHEINVDINLVNDVINEALTRDIFDINLYKQYEILTSKGIQKRYKEMVKRRKDVEVVEEYLLINGDFGVNANIIKVNDSNNNTSSIVNDSKSTQSKVNKTKVNKSKQNNSNNVVVFSAKNNYEDVNVQIEKFTNDQELKTILNEFVNMRKKIKKPLTNYAFSLLLKKLNKEAPNDAGLQKDLLNQSILKSWQDIYPLSKDYVRQWGKEIKYPSGGVVYPDEK